ncbi:MAG: hypothetical protein ACOVQT_13160 [Rubrivivax sp.]
MPTRKKTAAPDVSAPTAASRSRQPTRVTLSLREGAPITLELPGQFEALAMRWSYIARNRERWHLRGDDPAQGTGNPLCGLIAPADVKRIAEQAAVEVHIDADPRSEPYGWALRLFPWEYALSALTRGQRRGPLTVVRLIGPLRHEPPTVSLARPAVLRSMPGGLDRWYDGAAESELMLTSMGLSAQAGDRLVNPTLATLQGWLQGGKPAPTLIHVAGVDNHQATALLRLPVAAESSRDGMALARGGGNGPGVELVDVESLAPWLTVGRPPPELVVFNFYNSAVRLASRTVALGARFAIGYYDVIDDGLAAQFCATLYRELQGGNGHVLEAFQAALLQLRAHPDVLRGACIVLWSAVPLLRPVAQPAAATRRAPGAERTRDKVEPRHKISVSCKPLPRVNYSLLHNKLSMFQTLQVYRNNVEGEIRDIEVRVTLNTGEASVPFVTSFSLPAGKALEDLTPRVVVPLTSALIRSQSERVQSSVTVEVLCEQQRSYLETHRVGLCPVDEWQDGEQREWGLLPSFVLPRDPAVPQIIDAAQALLCTLADDPAAGFDGYQSIDPGATDPELRYAAVDRQVQAIWHTLVHIHPLSYINPPPSYGVSTQRVRTPTQVIGERRGTCIDLTLLLASCLEYVDIYPVIFLLTGHAFVGYWRGDDLHTQFLAFKGLEPGFAGEPDSERMAAGSAGTLQGAQVIDQGQHLELLQRVQAGQIVPLEATWLCQRGGFAAAAEEGRRNLRLKSEFQAMVDVRIARDRDVTPLPLLGEKT